ncbi:hypothetical protein QQZ08_002805 [Neonectria magnoliae]|uniref:Protein kinase domain-containing protein n=1 Tax=Neonectria magnoliae TaxID=2732573 RepID=A0ABR1IBQ1_9HYPO
MEKRILLDAVFPVISQLLMLGIPEKMDTFVAKGRTDHDRPFSEGNLPDIIKGSSQRSSFLNLQSIVRYQREEDPSGLEEDGDHVHLPAHADAYFLSLAMLGKGRFAQVDKAYSRRTLKTYARKQIQGGQSVLEDKFQLASFEKELQSLKAISHRYIVKLVGSYTNSTALKLIMCPVTNTDLHQYLNSVEVDPDLRKKSQRTFFGCLVTALAYIHKKNIRHKDIKPNNVLVKGGQVLLADFGTSRICLDGHLTTNGEPKEGTPKYWAPDVMEGADRNTASDIWSLGCVFLEMTNTLLGYMHNDMLVFYSRNGTEYYRTICLNEPATELWIEKLHGSGAGFDSLSSTRQSGCYRRSPTIGPLRLSYDTETADPLYVSESTPSSSVLDQQLSDSVSHASQESLADVQDKLTKQEAKDAIETPPKPSTPKPILVELKKPEKRHVTFSTESM